MHMDVCLHAELLDICSMAYACSLAPNYALPMTGLALGNQDEDCPQQACHHSQHDLSIWQTPT